MRENRENQAQNPRRNDDHIEDRPALIRIVTPIVAARLVVVMREEKGLIMLHVLPIVKSSEIICIHVGEI